MTRELIVLVADGTMAAVLRAFVERQFYHALECAPLDFHATSDIVYDPLNTDGGVHRRCHDTLRPYLNTHRRALVVLDQQFGSEHPADEVRGVMDNASTPMAGRDALPPSSSIPSSRCCSGRTIHTSSERSGTLAVASAAPCPRWAMAVGSGEASRAEGSHPEAHSC
jgi:hypothetical protein